MSAISSLKKAILIGAVLFCGCQNATQTATTSGDNEQITPAEKEQAQKAIAARIDEIIRGCTQLNADTALNPYSNTPDFVIVNPDGSVTNFNKMKQDQDAFFKSANFVKFVTTKEDFKFLSKTLVMCTWHGTDEYQLKTGEHMKIDPYVGSMLFSNTGKEWTIIYAHESSAQAAKVAK